MLKFPRTIRLDPSDTFVFERAAEPGEWAVSGAFVFWNRDPGTLGQKQRVALRSGFLVHVSKPVEPSGLVATVATVSGRSGEHAE
jgi:hypothetical protein